MPRDVSKTRSILYTSLDVCNRDMSAALIMLKKILDFQFRNESPGTIYLAHANDNSSSKE